MNASGSSVSCSENESARASTRLESWLDTDVMRNTMTATLSASAGSTAGPGRSSCGARRSVMRLRREQAERA